jgi:6-pyruvoyltetrahydropterin/6-carboxytetrahydropterin synthase
MFRPDLNDKQNEEMYGLCSNPHWHGHNYILFVTVKGEINPEIGYLINLSRLKQIIKENIIDKLDHKNLNTQVDFMKNKILSTENLVVGIWNILEPVIKKEGADLHCVRIEETENNFIEYYG